MIGVGTMRRLAGEIRRDVAAAHERDPAARGVSSLEILASWPGVHALLAHRVLHALHETGVPLLPRLLATATRATTNIEIHPAAKIGANSVVITDVPPNSTVVGNPGHVVRVDGRKLEGPDADWIHLPDPVADAIRGLASRIEALEHAVAEMAGHDAEPAEVRPLRPARGRNPAGG